MDTEDLFRLEEVILLKTYQKIIKQKYSTNYYQRNLSISLRKIITYLLSIDSNFIIKKTNTKKLTNANNKTKI